MDWRKVVVNALSALATAILGGLLVWWLTRPPLQEDKLVFNEKPTANFSVGRSNYAFSDVVIWNAGTDPAKDVTIEIKDSNEGSLKDFKLSRSRSLPQYAVNRRSESVLVTLPTLLPRERVAISSLFVSEREDKILHVIKSSSALATQENPNNTKPTYSTWIGFITALLAIVFFYVTRKFLRKRLAGILTELIPNRNDAGFLLLHANALDEAKKVLWRAIEGGDASPLALSNYGAALAISGEHDHGLALIEAAKQHASINHHRGVTSFNEGIALFCAGKVSEAKIAMTTSVKQSPVVKDYFRKSKLCSDLFASNADISNLFD